MADLPLMLIMEYDNNPGKCPQHARRPSTAPVL
jgi:hypothetical protein